MAQTQVNIHYAKTHLSQLLAQVEKGDEIIIARAGKPVARITTTVTPMTKAPFGFAKDRFKVHPSFFDPMTAEELDLWEKWEE